MATQSIEELTPKQIVEHLDAYIVGQAEAKKAVAVALRNRYRRQRLPEDERKEIIPKNILMIGPTGVGKTEIARRLAQMAKAPMVKVEATKFTEVGYVGRDVESMIRDLAAASVRLVEEEKIAAARPQAEKAAEDELVRLIDEQLHGRSHKKKRRGMSKADVENNPLLKQAFDIFGHQAEEEPEDEPDEPEEEERPVESQSERRERIRRELKDGKHEDVTVEVETEDQSNPFLQVFSPGGMEEMGLDMTSALNPFSKGQKKTQRKIPVREAREVLIENEARKRIDQSSVNREAIHRAEQSGMIFLDEVDKIAIKRGQGGPDVSREGVQRDLLPIIEGSTVTTKYGQLNTDHILFIAAGAFHESKPSDLIPELQGRLPIRVELESLTRKDFERILSEPQNAITKQYQKLLSVEGVELEFTPEALAELARLAAEVNEKMENIGARRLQTLLEKLLEQTMFDAPDVTDKKVVVDPAMVGERLSGLVEDTDLSRYIL